MSLTSGVSLHPTPPCPSQCARAVMSNGFRACVRACMWVGVRACVRACVCVCVGSDEKDVE